MIEMGLYNGDALAYHIILMMFMADESDISFLSLDSSYLYLPPNRHFILTNLQVFPHVLQKYPH